MVANVPTGSRYIFALAFSLFIRVPMAVFHAVVITTVRRVAHQ